ncbi:unnamed protein product [Pleuronectes platessa]|uniref:Uncharacterized protein n=1 Tax=Pleuronectes platessa TaxID=8262 RepID=A0A9N7V045_PLEPL|nr:unnamed protein product [Pleuronectes platessa]
MTGVIDRWATLLLVETGVHQRDMETTPIISKPPNSSRGGSAWKVKSRYHTFDSRGYWRRRLEEAFVPHGLREGSRGERKGSSAGAGVPRVDPQETGWSRWLEPLADREPTSQTRVRFAQAARRKPGNRPRVAQHLENSDSGSEIQESCCLCESESRCESREFSVNTGGCLDRTEIDLNHRRHQMWSSEDFDLCQNANEVLTPSCKAGDMSEELFVQLLQPRCQIRERVWTGSSHDSDQLSRGEKEKTQETWSPTPSLITAALILVMNSAAQCPEWQRSAGHWEDWWDQWL